MGRQATQAFRQSFAARYDADREARKDARPFTLEFVPEAEVRETDEVEARDVVNGVPMAFVRRPKSED